MANISKLKRKKMLDFLNELKSLNEDEDTLRIINEIELEITNKKYGLLWEEHEEKVDIRMKNEIPVFSEIKEKEITLGSNEDVNFLLEGDNLHSLKLLEKTHKGKIDLIYIDPPYNTGNEDFMYNDVYIDEDDEFKHSKWLSFMEKRLKIAGKLLSPKGFIAISIDDKESSQLRLLCDSVFGSDNYENTNYIQVRYPDKTLKQDMSYHKQIEQVLVYKKSDLAKPYQEEINYSYDKFVYSIEEIGKGEKISLGGKDVVVFQPNEYKIVEHKTSSKDLLKEIWATGTILNGNSSGRFFRDYLDGRKDIDGLGVLYKVYDIGDDQYNYRYFTGPKRANAKRGKYYQGVPVEKLSDGAVKTLPIPNFYDMSGDFGNIRHEGGVPFNSGKKPIKMIKMFLKYFDRKDITVLDFFAGSGSTAHAVLDLNKEDEGSRKFILCTNNENKICEEVTYKRVRNVIEGYETESGSYVKGIPANLKYYKTDFVLKNSTDSDYIGREEILKYIKEMVQLEHGVNIDNSRYIILLNDEDADFIEEKKEYLENCEKIYISSQVLLTRSQERLFNDLDIELVSIPDYYFDKELRDMGELCLC